MVILSHLIRTSEEVRTHLKRHPVVKGLYRTLIHLLCSEEVVLHESVEYLRLQMQVEVIVHSLCILSAMAHHDPLIRDKLFSVNNVHQARTAISITLKLKLCAI